MKIKSLEELKEIRKNSINRVNLRHDKENNNELEVLIGMSTCGIASGARETLNRFIERLAIENLNNVKVIPVGCIGYCHSEPTVQINIPGKDTVYYGNIKKDKVDEIVDKHIKNGSVVKNLVLEVDFTRA